MDLDEAFLPDLPAVPQACATAPPQLTSRGWWRRPLAPNQIVMLRQPLPGAASPRRKRPGLEQHAEADVSAADQDFWRAQALRQSVMARSDNHTASLRPPAGWCLGSRRLGVSAAALKGGWVRLL